MAFLTCRTRAEPLLPRCHCPLSQQWHRSYHDLLIPHYLLCAWHCYRLHSQDEKQIPRKRFLKKSNFSFYKNIKHAQVKFLKLYLCKCCKKSLQSSIKPSEASDARPHTQNCVVLRSITPYVNVTHTWLHGQPLILFVLLLLLFICLNLDLSPVNTFSVLWRWEEEA